MLSKYFQLLRMAQNARTSKLTSGKADQYTFNWKLFTGWDYTIGNAETASNAVMANVNKLRVGIILYILYVFTCNRNQSPNIASKLRANFSCFDFVYE
jgi:hypothetical protein